MYMMAPDRTKTKAVFTRTEMNNEWYVTFLENSSLGIQ